MRGTRLPAYDLQAVRADFPILSRRINGEPLVYLDNAATTQKPQAVIDALSDYYSSHNANVHRGIHTLAEEATASYEATRDLVAKWVGDVKREEIVFTSGATESINLVASSWGERNLKVGDRVLLTRMEHHANLVPWLQVAQKTGAEVVYIPIMGDGLLDIEAAEKILSDGRVRLVALTHVSNVLGTINPVAEMVSLAKNHGAVTLVDGAQAVPHQAVNIPEIGADFYAFSAHKMLGPTGVGVLYGREDILGGMEPYQTGGEMIRLVTYEKATWADLPHRFEAGTPNIAGVIAFAKAIEYLKSLGMAAIRDHERELTSNLLSAFDALPWLMVFGPRELSERAGVVSFEVEGVHPHDLAQFLDSKGIAVRAGHHCAQPLTKLLGRTSTTRASVYLYNTADEIDQVVEAVREARRYFVGN
ncbi:MAG: cysteine desulfurase [bacterium]